MCTKLNFDVSKVLDHVHTVTLDLADVKHAPLSGRDFLLNLSLNHTHSFHLTQFELLELQAGKKVTVQSTDNGAAPSSTNPLVANHHHTIEVTCVKTKFYQQVWFWLLIIILIVALVILANQKKAKKTFTNFKNSATQKYNNFKNRARNDFSRGQVEMSQFGI